MARKTRGCTATSARQEKGRWMNGWRQFKRGDTGLLPCNLQQRLYVCFSPASRLLLPLTDQVDGGGCRKVGDRPHSALLLPPPHHARRKAKQRQRGGAAQHAQREEGHGGIAPHFPLVAAGAVHDACGRGRGWGKRVAAAMR